MGLSIEERTRHVYDAIAAIQNERSALTEARNPSYDDTVQRMRRCVDGLWHAFLKGHANRALWLLGSGASEAVREQADDPMSVALFANVGQMRRTHDHELMLSQPDFDVFDHFLSIPGLLEEEDPAMAAIFRIYQHAEQLAYGLRRYDDDAFPEALDRHLSDLQGIAYEAVRENRLVTKAYLLHRMARIVYGPLYPYDLEDADTDPITRIVARENMHHDMRVRMRPGNPVEDVIERHKALAGALGDALTRTNGMAPRAHARIGFERIEAALWMAGRRYHYDHKHRGLLKKLDTPEGRAALVEDEHDSRLSAIKDRLAACKREHQSINARENRQRVREHAQKETEIHWN